MSKPDPSITANLLGSLTGKLGAEIAVANAQSGVSGQPEHHPAPSAHKTTKPAPTKHTSGRTRMSNRGK